MKKFTQKKKNDKGFSLVELIVVIAIMAVLMAVLVPTLVKNVEKSRLQSDKSALAELRQAVVTVVADDKYVSVKGAEAQPIASGAVDVSALFASDKTDILTAFTGEIDGIMGESIKLKSALADGTSKTVRIFMDARNGLVVLDVSAGDKDSFHITSSGEHSGTASSCSECKDKAPVKTTP